MRFTYRESAVPARPAAFAPHALRDLIAATKLDLDCPMPGAQRPVRAFAGACPANRVSE